MAIVGLSGSVTRPSRTTALVRSVLDRFESRLGEETRLIELSWDIDHNCKLAQIAENNGFDYALSQIRFTAGYRADNQHEPVTFSQALLAATDRLKVIVALLPGPWNPAVAAKQIATINNIYGGRVAVNVVSGWFRGEFTAIGEPWLDHDERYRRSEEFIGPCAPSGARTVSPSGAISTASPMTA